MEESLALSLKQTLQEKMNNGGFKRGELKNIFASYAEKYGKKQETVKSYYYRVLKPELDNESKSKSDNKSTAIVEEDPPTNIDSTSIKIINEEKKDIPYGTKIYPSESEDIHSYLTGGDTVEEWVNLMQVSKNFDGKSFKEYIKNLSIKTKNIYIPEQDQVVQAVQKEELLRILKDFSSYTRINLANRQALDLYSLLQKTDAELEEEKTKKYYNSLSIGEVVSVKVTKIMSYGAFVEFIEFPQITGMIHISEITDGYVKDINDYFFLDQTIDAKIIQLGDKLNLSTKDFDLNTLNKSTTFIASSPSPTENNNLTSVPNREEIESILSSEWTEVVEYMKSYVGPLSPKAKEKLKGLIQEYGLFKFTLGINDAAKDFTSDLGLLLLCEAEEKLRDGL